MVNVNSAKADETAGVTAAEPLVAADPASETPSTTTTRSSIGACPTGLTAAQDQYSAKLRASSSVPGTAVAVAGPPRDKLGAGTTVDSVSSTSEASASSKAAAADPALRKVGFGTLAASAANLSRAEEQLGRLEHKCMEQAGGGGGEGGGSGVGGDPEGFFEAVPDGIEDLPSNTPREPAQPGAISVGGNGSSVVRDSATEDAEAELESGPHCSPRPPSEEEDDQGQQGMVQARPVEEEDIVDASPVYPEDQQRMAANKSEGRATYTVALVLAGVALLAIIVGVAIGVSLKKTKQNGNQSEEDLAANNASRPTSAPSCSYQNVSILDLPEATLKKAICAPESPQYEAYKWLLQDPNLDTYPNWKATQRFALATFYFATGGDGWSINSNWLEYDLDECTDWFFRPGRPTEQQPWVQRERRHLRALQHDSGSVNTTATTACDQDGRYIVISMSQNNMAGHIPPEIGLLSQLEYLDLSAQDKLGGQIPSELGQLSQLRRLAIDRNFHTGTIPTELALMTGLEEIFMGYNQEIEGPIPSELGNLHANLFALGFRRSGIQGFVPTELYRLTNLRELYIQNCPRLTGGTLEGIGNLSNLQRFAAHDIPYATSIPTEIGLLTDMRALNFWNTQHTGSLPSEFFLMTNMVRLDIDDNYFTGTFPTEFKAFSHLEVAWLNGNQFSGTLPADLWQHWTNLTILKTNDLLISGTIPTEVGLLENIQKLWFANLTLITGTIPSELGQMKQIEELFLHFNPNVYGTIPSEMEDLPNLSFMTLSNTSLTGSIPPTLCEELQDMVFVCASLLGVEDQLCVDVEQRNFSCHLSHFCGCDCGPCTEN